MELYGNGEFGNHETRTIITEEGLREERIFGAPFAGAGNRTSPQVYYNQHNGGCNFSGQGRRSYDGSPSGAVRFNSRPYPYGSLSSTGGYFQNGTAGQQQALFPNGGQNGYAATVNFSNNTTAESPGLSTSNIQQQSSTPQACIQQQTSELFEAMRCQIETLIAGQNQMVVVAIKMEEEVGKQNSEVRKMLEEVASSAKIKNDRTDAQHSAIMESLNEIAARLIASDVGSSGTSQKISEKPDYIFTEVKGRPNNSGRKSKAQGAKAKEGRSDPPDEQRRQAESMFEQGGREQAWFAGLNAHLEAEQIQQIINREVGGPCEILRRGHYGGSVVVLLAPGVTLKQVLKLDGKKNVPGFNKNGQNPGMRVRAVGDYDQNQQGRGGGARSEGGHQQGRATYGQPQASRSQIPEAGRNGRSQQERPRPQKEDKPDDQGGGPQTNTQAQLGNVTELETPGAAAAKLFDERADFSDEKFVERMQEELQGRNKMFSSNQMCRALKKYRKLQRSGGMLPVNSSPRLSAGSLSEPVRPLLAASPPSAKDRSKDVPNQRKEEFSHPDENADEFRHLNALASHASPTASQSIGEKGGDGDKGPVLAPPPMSHPAKDRIGTVGGDVEKGSEPAQIHVPPEHTQQEIENLYVWDSDKFKLEAKGLDKFLKLKDKMTMPVLGEGDCFYLAAYLEADHFRAAKLTCEAFFDEFEGGVMEHLISTKILTWGQARDFPKKYREHIKKDRMRLTSRACVFARWR